MPLAVLTPSWLLLSLAGIAYPFGVRITSRCKSFHINAKVKSFLKIISWNLLPSRRTKKRERSVENGSGSAWRGHAKKNCGAALQWATWSKCCILDFCVLFGLAYVLSLPPSLPLSLSPLHLEVTCYLFVYVCACVCSSPSLSLFLRVRVCDILFAWLWQLSLGFWVSFILLRNWQRAVPFHSCCSRSRRRRLTLSTDLLDF